MTSPQDVIDRWLKQASAVGDQDRYYAKRGEERYAWSIDLEMQVGAEMQYVRSRDIALSGIGLNCRARLTAGTPVKLRERPDDAWVPARVQHVTQTVGGYKVGLLFVPE